MPDEIARAGHATCKACTVKRHNAKNRRRYYERIGIPEGFRLCGWCGLPKQIGVDMTPMGRTCAQCRRERSVAGSRVNRYDRIARMNEEELAAHRAKAAAKARRQRSTPEGRARHNATQKAWREANPEAAAASQKRYRKKMMADPERAAEWRDYQRIYHRGWRERKGMVPRHLSEEEYRAGNGKIPDGTGHHWVPAAPLVPLISEWLGDLRGVELGRRDDPMRAGVHGAGYEALADLTGISSRTLVEIANGDRKRVRYANADVICAVTGTPLSSIYDEP